MVDFLAVGIHPDDIELGIGGTVASLIKQGKSVTLLDLTSGEPTPHGTEEKRKAETEKSNSILKVEKRILLGFKNRELMDSVEGRMKVAEVYRQERPKTLFLPYWEDAHPDHVQGSKLATAARFVAKYTKTDMGGESFYPPSVFYYFCIHLRKQIKPTFIFDISDTLKQKMDALRAYQSQFFGKGEEHGEKILRKLETEAAYFGSLIGTDHGEPLLAAEEVGINSFDALIP